MLELDVKDQHILNIATKHFALYGYGSTRMDAIAEEAQVNKATIYYRIGDKTALFEKVYSLMLDALIDKLSTTCKSVEDPTLALKHYIDTFAELCDNNPFISRMVLREVASQGQHLSESSIQKMQQIRNILTEVIHRGTNSGHFNQANPFLIHMLIIGFLNFYSAGKPIRDKISELDDATNHYNIPSTQEAGHEIFNLVIKSISTENT